MRAVITGASGLIGTAVRRTLEAAGWTVVGLDLRPSPGVEPADISRPGAWTSTLAGADLVVHAAAKVGEQGTLRDFVHLNVDATGQVLEACRAGGVGRVVHLSSIVVHGLDFPDGVDETGPVHPTGNPYTDTKIAGEHLALLHAASGLPVTVVRPGDVYGPGSEQWTIRPVRLMRRGLYRLVGDGVLSPVYVDDVAAGIVALGTAPAAAGQVFHVTGGVGVPTADFFAHYGRALGISARRLPRGALPALTALAPLAHRLGLEPPLTASTVEYLSHPGTYSIAKARELAGWTPAVDLDEGMRRTVAWLRLQGLMPDGRTNKSLTRPSGPR